MKDMGDIIRRENGKITNLWDIAAKKLAVGGIKLMRAKIAGEVSGKCLSETRTGLELNTQRMLILRTKDASHIRDMQEGGH